MTLRLRWMVVLLSAAFVLVGVTTFRPVTGEAQQMTQLQGEPPRDIQLQQWQHPRTGEKVTVQFGGVTTTVKRGGKITEFRPPAFNEAAGLAQAREHLRWTYRWDIMNVASWCERLIMSKGSVAAAQKEFQSLGFPRQLWDDIDAYLKHIGKPLPKDGLPDVATAYAGSLTIVGEGEESPPARNGLTIVRLDDPAFKSNLLFHPTPEVKATFEQLYLKENISVAAPPAEMTLHEQTHQLAEQGFVRLTARRPDGSLWLTPALEPHRAALEAAQKPVVRLSADPKRQPQLWESKVGGVPYRTKGTAWPLSTEKTPRPLVFLAQVNFAESNPDRKNLPSYPSKGILQFFILNGEFMGAEAMFSAGGDPFELSGPQGNYRVVYHPEVIQDVSKLETTAVKPEYDAAEVTRLQEAGHNSLIGEEYLIRDHLPFEKVPLPAVALSGTPDREPLSGPDDTKVNLLNLPENYRQDEKAQAVVSDLYDIAPGKHKIGGYPDFTQSDPRRADTNWVLLFQLDSDPALNLMWGDVGTANFFIRPADLEKHDFTKVVYHWDCG